MIMCITVALTSCMVMEQSQQLYSLHWIEKLIKTALLEQFFTALTVRQLSRNNSQLLASLVHWDPGAAVTALTC
jgi:hypothetical protein